MKDQVLSIEQMQKLKELGIDTSKASITWFKENKCADYDLGIYSKSISDLYEFIPTFTLQDMIELMPNNVIKDNTEFYLIIDKYTIGYIDITEEYLVHKSYNGLLNNAFDMLVWLAENKYI